VGGERVQATKAPKGVAAPGPPAREPRLREQRREARGSEPHRLAAPPAWRFPLGVPPPVERATAGAGASLDEPVRTFLESRFAHDFSLVRVHTDRRAAAAADHLGARAVTAGEHVLFAPDAYRPGTEQGRRLLAHELTHVVQQRTRGTGTSSAGAAAEREAEDAVSAIFSRAGGAVVRDGGSPVPAVQRYEAREHVLAGQAGPAALSRAVGLLSEAELQLRRGRSAFQELALLRNLWEQNGGDPEALRLFELASNANDEANYREALDKVEQATPKVMAWLREHAEAGGGVSTRIAGREHPEASRLLAEAGDVPRIRLRRSGLEIGYDEAVALGDFYVAHGARLENAQRALGDVSVGVEAMHNAPREELTNSEGTGILDMIRAEIAGRRAGLDLAYQRATQWRDVVRYDRLGKRLGREGEFELGLERTIAEPKPEEHGLSYLELAKSDIHFARENRATWERGHLDAIQKAEEAGRERDAATRRARANDAYLTNALADHFLTDAFAAGHLLYKSQFRQVAAEFVRQNHDRVLDAIASSFVRDHRGALFELVSWGVSSAIRKVPVLGAIPVLGGLAGLVVGAFAGVVSLFAPGLLEGIVKSKIRDLEQRPDQKGLLVNIASKVAHDYYNREGVEVTNARGDTWRTFGDENLNRSSATWQLLSLAVLRSRADIAETLGGARPEDPLDALSYVPIPPPDFDRQATAKAGELLLRPRDNPAAHLMAQNIDVVKAGTEFDEREAERRREAGERKDRVGRYLEHIRTTGRIEDRMDSDDVARDIVATPDVYAGLRVSEKAILVQEMLTGWTGGDDQRAILAVLREVHARGQLRDLLRKVTVPRLRSKLGGAELREALELASRVGMQ
jgi:Domain of unknown function (DUF4157)